MYIHVYACTLSMYFLPIEEGETEGGERERERLLSVQLPGLSSSGSIHAALQSVRKNKFKLFHKGQMRKPNQFKLSCWLR